MLSGWELSSPPGQGGCCQPAPAPGFFLSIRAGQGWQARQRLTLAQARSPCPCPRGRARSLTRLQPRWDAPPTAPAGQVWPAAGSLPRPHRPQGRPSEPDLARSPH